MNGMVLSERSCAALTAAVDKELELTLASCPAPAPSKAFEARMEGLIAEEKRPVRRLVNSRAKHVAAALIAAVLLLTVVSFTSERIRSSVAGFFVQTFGDHSEYFNPGVTKTSIEEEYGLVPVPEGFVEYKTIIEDDYLSRIYAKDENSLISLLQQAGSSVSESVDNEHGVIDEYEINGKTVLIYLSGKAAHAAWTENGYYFSLAFTSFSQVDLDQIIDYVSSVAFKL